MLVIRSLTPSITSIFLLAYKCPRTRPQPIGVIRVLRHIWIKKSDRKRSVCVWGGGRGARGANKSPPLLGGRPGCRSFNSTIILLLICTQPPIYRPHESAVERAGGTEGSGCPAGGVEDQDREPERWRDREREGQREREREGQSLRERERKRGEK